MPFGTEKLEWCGYPMVKNFDGMFIRFDRIHERDRQTDRQTPHDGQAALAATSNSIKCVAAMELDHHLRYKKMSLNWRERLKKAKCLYFLAQDGVLVAKSSDRRKWQQWQRPSCGHGRQS